MCIVISIVMDADSSDHQIYSKNICIIYTISNVCNVHLTHIFSAHKLHNFLTGNITAQSIHGRFASSVTKLKEDLDPKQEFALQEQCFLVDMNDKIIGTASKKECHLVKKDGSIPLHRAFSVFLFNNKGDLLLQKRANTKVNYNIFSIVIIVCLKCILNVIKTKSTRFRCE